MHETWKFIKGYENKYEVSNLGRVRNSKGQLMKPQINKKGYLRYTLWSNNKNKLFFIQRLVMETFSPIDNMNELQVNHIDGNKENNKIENLEWVTNQENHNHARRTGLYTEEGLKKSIKGLIKSNLRQRKRVGKYDLKTGELLEEFNSIKEASISIGCDSSNIGHCCNGRQKSVKGFSWKYL